MIENKKCPIENLLSFNFNHEKIKNIMLILMTLKTIWEFFKNDSKIDINEMILSNLCKPGDFIGQQIPNVINTPNMENCKGWNIFNFLLLGFFIYIIFFIKDIFENINLFSYQIKQEEIEKNEKI